MIEQFLVWVPVQGLHEAELREQEAVPEQGRKSVDQAHRATVPGSGGRMVVREEKIGFGRHGELEIRPRVFTTFSHRINSSPSECVPLNPFTEVVTHLRFSSELSPPKLFGIS